MEDLHVRVGLKERAFTQGVLLHSLIRDHHHVKCRSTGCLPCYNMFGKHPVKTMPTIIAHSWLRPQVDLPVDLPTMKYYTVFFVDLYFTNVMCTIYFFDIIGELVE